MNTASQGFEALRRSWAQREEGLNRQFLSSDWANIRDAWNLLKEHGRNVLDLGCGSGMLTIRLAASEPSCQFVGVDLRDDVIAKASKRATSDGVPNVSFCQGDAAALAFRDATFDVVWMRFLLQHTWEPERVVREAARVLRPHGQVLLWDWDESLVLMYPENPALRKLMAMRSAYAQRKGTNPQIGRRLPALLRGSGLVNLRTHLVSWNTCQPGRTWLTHFLSLDQASRRDNPIVVEGLIPSEEHAQLVAESREFVESQETFIWFGSIIAVGMKPSQT